MGNHWLRSLAFMVIASMTLFACQPAGMPPLPSTPTPQPTPTPYLLLPVPKATKALEPAQTPEASSVPEHTLTAPEPTPAESEEPADPWVDVDPSGQTVVFWHNHAYNRGETLSKIAAEFNAANPWGITVVSEFRGGISDLFDEMLAVLNTSESPDIVLAFQNQAATFYLEGGLVDMASLVNSQTWGFSEGDKNDFFPGFWAQDLFPTYGNARLGIPAYRSMELLYYNLDWLRELGYDSPPTTPEDFKEMACKARKQPFSSAVEDGPMGYALSISASRFASWTFAFGGDVFDKAASRFTYDSPAAQQAMSFLQDLVLSGCALLVTESYGDQDDFAAGKSLFTVSTSAGLPFYDSAVDEGAEFKWSVAALPHTTVDPVMNIYGPSLSIVRSTLGRELASWLFLKHFANPEAQARWAETSGYFPVRASVGADLGGYFTVNETYKISFDMLEYGRFEPSVPGYEFVRYKVAEAMAAILDGADVPSTLAVLNQEVNLYLAEQIISTTPNP